MRLLRDLFITISIVTLISGWSKGKGPGNREFQATGETLIGRWSALPKDEAAENPEKRYMTGPAGEVIKFLWEFRADHTFDMSVDGRVGAIAKLTLKNKVNGTWKALTPHGNTLPLELTLQGGGKETVKTEIVFESKDKCTFDFGDGQVLYRLP